MTSVCIDCLEDQFLKKRAIRKRNLVECSECGDNNKPGLDLEDLVELLLPVLDSNFRAGDEEKIFDGQDDDNGRWEQQGQDLDDIVTEIFDRKYSFQDELIDKICSVGESEIDGSSYWDRGSYYTEIEPDDAPILQEWNTALRSLKHGQRFFSSAASSLFMRLFTNINSAVAYKGGDTQPVVRRVPSGTAYFRARKCNNPATFAEMLVDPLKHVGAPPPQKARAGRMNADGIAVFYCSEDRDTCIAEVRPAIGEYVCSIKVLTTKVLRILDLTRMERVAAELSYFDPGFAEKSLLNRFVRHLHRLVSQPVVPEHEVDYLITQAMAEYLAHVHQPPLSGIAFSSPQHKGGLNVVLFARDARGRGQVFPVEYEADSIEACHINEILYRHSKVDHYRFNDGRVVFIHDHDEG